MKPQKGISTAAGIAIIILAAIVLFGGAFAYEYYFAKAPKIISAAPTTKTATADKTQQAQTAGWRTYTDAQYGFSFQYPSQFTADENSGYPASGDVLVTLRQSSYGDWTLSVAGPYSDLLQRDETFQESIAEYRQLFGNETGFQESSVTVAGAKADEFSMPQDGIQTIAIYVPTKNGSDISIQWKSSESVSAVRSVNNTVGQLDEILSTFQFTK